MGQHKQREMQVQGLVQGVQEDQSKLPYRMLQHQGSEWNFRVQPQPQDTQCLWVVEQHLRHHIHVQGRKAEVNG